MRKLNTFSLEPGMKLGRTIYGSKGEVLLSTGITLTRKYIQNLINLGVMDVYVDDGLLPDVILDEVISYETRMFAVNQVKNIMLDSKEKGELVLEPEPFYEAVDDIVAQLLSNNVILYNIIDLRTQDDYTFEHSVNVCVLSVLTGITMGYSRNELIDLGAGSLLHDLGKVKIPDIILNKPGKLNEKEFSIIMEHTCHGHSMIRATEYLGELPATIAYQHHENYDGSGYPNGVGGKDLHEFSQITAIADRFDAMTANRPYRKAIPSHEAYEMCSGAGNYLFKDVLIKAFLNNIAAYPTGTLVKLNNGMIGVVTGTTKGASLFPKVRIMLQEDLSPVKKQFEVRLEDKKELSIVRVFDESEGRLLTQALEKN